MSREERRQYQRMMRNMERGPALPPAARARAEHNAARRDRIRGSSSTSSRGLARNYWVRSVAVAVILGFLAFSLQWGDGMPFALYVGLAVGAVVLAVAAGFRFLRERAAAR